MAQGHIGFKALQFRITGVCPLLMHNGHLSDPTNKWVREMKKITAKRKKTDEDYEALAKLEFFGGLYVDKSGAPCVPGEVFEGTLINASKSFKLGKVAKAGLMSDGNWRVIYNGPTDPEKMWESGKYNDIRRVRVSTSAVMRCRPIFHEWSLEPTVQYLPSLLNPNQIKEIVEVGGQTVGIGDNRPRYGRYVVESCKEV